MSARRKRPDTAGPPTNRLMIRCPVTGNAVSTGMQMDQETFQTIELVDNALACPECRQIHTWSKADAFLERPN